MGKCGAHELNYVSDVDVIFVAEPAVSEGGADEQQVARVVGQEHLAVAPHLVGPHPDLVGRDRLGVGVVDGQQVARERLVPVRSQGTGDAVTGGEPTLGLPGHRGLTEPVGQVERVRLVVRRRLVRWVHSLTEPVTGGTARRPTTGRCDGRRGRGPGRRRGR